MRTPCVLALAVFLAGCGKPPAQVKEEKLPKLTPRINYAKDVDVDVDLDVEALLRGGLTAQDVDVEATLPVSSDVLMTVIVSGSLLTSVVINFFVRPVPAFLWAATAGTLICIVVYTAPRFASEGLPGLMDDLAHPLDWIIALAFGVLQSGFVASCAVVCRHLFRPR